LQEEAALRRAALQKAVEEARLVTSRAAEEARLAQSRAALAELRVAELQEEDEAKVDGMALLESGITTLKFEDDESAELRRAKTAADQARRAAEKETRRHAHAARRTASEKGIAKLVAMRAQFVAMYEATTTEAAEEGTDAQELSERQTPTRYKIDGEGAVSALTLRTTGLTHG
jgi:hypothetical protein